MKKMLKIILCLLMLLNLCACTEKEDEKTDEKVDVVTEDKTDSQVSIPGLEDQYQSNAKQESWGISVDFMNNETAAYAFETYRDFSNRFLLNSLERGKNIFVSPFSAYYALAILSNGAAGNTRNALENALGMSVHDLNYFLKDVDDAYTKSEWGNSYTKANSLLFNTAKGLSLSKEYKDTINTFYGDCALQEDFKDGKDVSDKVNAWAKENTGGMISDILNTDEIDEETPFLILNALATGDKWMFPFDPEKTNYQQFHNYDGSSGMVEMMHQRLNGHWNDELSEGFTIMLQNGVLVTGILPNEGVDVYDYLNQMKKDSLVPYAQISTEYDNVEDGGDMGCTADLHFTDLSFPKFSLKGEYDLDETLKKMGLQDLFDDQICDLSAMAEGDKEIIDQLYVKKVKQKTSLDVNEEEVVASAVTIIEGGLGAGGCTVRDTYYHTVTFDRPFIIILSHGARDLVLPLFMGVVSELGEDVKEAVRIENITGKINIRSLPSTKGEKLGMFAKGEILYAFETKEAEGYTWYRIGENKWVADQKGEWIKVLD